MHDIAKALGIDRSTVSLALRNHPRISAETRKKVREMAEQLGYRPDPMLSAIAHYRRSGVIRPVTSEIAWINHWSAPQKLRSYGEFDLYWKGACEVAVRSGYQIEEYSLHGSTPMTLERIEKILRARNVRGVLIPPGGNAGVDWSHFPWQNYAGIRFGHSIPDLPLHVVTANQEQGGMMAFAKISERGYRRIGYVTTTSAESCMLFLGGYYLAQFRTPGIPMISPLKLDQKERRTDITRLAAWIKKEKPDAIFTSVGEMSEMLTYLGLRVPDDIGLATTSILDGNADSGLNQNSFEIGGLAVEILISQMNQNRYGFFSHPRMSTVDADWVDGTSLPRKEIAG